MEVLGQKAQTREVLRWIEKGERLGERAGTERRGRGRRHSPWRWRQENRDARESGGRGGEGQGKGCEGSGGPA